MDTKMDSQNFTADFGTAIRWLKEGKKVASSLLEFGKEIKNE